MEVRWGAEACDLGPDPESGAMVTRMTSAVMANTNIYCEQPYTTPDGKRIAVVRSQAANPCAGVFQLCVAELESLRIAPLADDCASFPATSAWSGVLYYLTKDRQLARVSLVTLEKETLFPCDDLPEDFTPQSVSPDHRYLIGLARRPDYVSTVVRVDLKSGTHETIFEHPEIWNPHMQFNPVHGRDILVQMNRGAKMDHRGRRLPVEGSEPGTTHIIIDSDGGNVRALPVGPPHTASSTGHSAWVADTGRMAVTVAWGDLLHAGPHDSRHPRGNLVTAAPGEERPMLFEAPEHRFNHLCVSRCGRYFVSDSYWKGLPRNIALVVGNLQSGKYRIVVSDCGAWGAASAGSHPHPYLTADNRYVVYNADPFLVPHVFVARLPDGFLESLD